MKIVVNSAELAAHLKQAIKVINSKNSLPILDCFKITVSENVLTVTTSDLENIFSSKFPIESDSDFSFCIDAKRFLNCVSNLDQAPITIEINNETFEIAILTDNGKFSIIGQDSNDFPEVEISNFETSINLDFAYIKKAILKTVNFTANDELRPVMNGIFLQFLNDKLVGVASDAHTLSVHENYNIKFETEKSIILTTKSANILQNSFSGYVSIKIGDKNVVFENQNLEIICRLTEGVYPNFRAVIPTNETFFDVNKTDLLKSIKRISLFSSAASGLIKLNFDNDLLSVSAQDIDFSVSAYERLNVSGDEIIEIGFNSEKLMKSIANIEDNNIQILLTDSSRAAVLKPIFQKNNESDLILIMPCLIN